MAEVMPFRDDRFDSVTHACDQNRMRFSLGLAETFLKNVSVHAVQPIFYFDVSRAVSTKALSDLSVVPAQQFFDFKTLRPRRFDRLISRKVAPGIS